MTPSSYIGVMNSTKEKVQSSQGVDSQVDPSSVDISVIEKALKQDVFMAILCLDAMYSDPDLLRHVALFMQGRAINQANAAKAKLDAKS